MGKGNSFRTHRLMPSTEAGVCHLQHLIFSDIGSVFQEVLENLAFKLPRSSLKNPRKTARWTQVFLGFHAKDRYKVKSC